VDAAVIAVIAALLAFGYRDAFVTRGGETPLLRMAADGVRMIVASPRLRALFPAYFVLFGGWLLAYIYVPLVVAGIHRGADPATTIGIVLGASGFAALVASPAIGAIADRAGHWRTLFVGSAATVVLWIVPYFTRELVAFTIAWTVANAIVSGVFSVSFNVLSSSTTDATRGRVMTFAYLPANMGFVIGPGIGAVVASRDVFLVFPAAAVLTALGLGALAYAYRQRV
jgi:MFS family permease